MAGSTNHFGLSVHGAGDKFSLSGYKYVNADRVLIDALLHLGTTGHRHTGLPGSNSAPTLPLNLSLTTTSGQLEAGTRYYYKYTLVDVYGTETSPSPVTFIDTPNPVASPGAPTLTKLSVGGSLLPGNYFYVLTAYQTVNTRETRAQNPNSKTITGNSVNNMITLTLPTLPGGATGFNIYRRRPGSSAYFYIDSVDMAVATPPSVYVDDGSANENCARTAPSKNTTSSNNTITVTTPGATPVVPVGYAWRLYRSKVNGDWDNTLVHHVVEETSEGSGVITPIYVDEGYTTSAGTPPTSSVIVDSPEQINLTDALEIQGRAPMGAVSAFPFAVPFVHPGLVVPTTGTFVFPIPFPQATMIGAQAILGLGRAPASDPVIVDVIVQRPGDDPFSIFGDDIENKATIPVSEQSSPMTPALLFSAELLAGDMVSVDIIQNGGGATPTDYDLTVVVYMYVYGYGLVSHFWAS